MQTMTGPNGTKSASRRRVVSTVVMSVVLVGCMTTWGACQPALDLSSFAVVQIFGLPNASTARQFGMGGTVASVWDVNFGNPALVATLQEPNAGVEFAVTDFDLGPRLVSEHGHYNILLPARSWRRQGLELSLFNLEGRPGAIFLPPPPGSATPIPATLSMSEQDAAISYALQLGQQWVAGVAVMPYSHVSLDVALPDGTPLLMVRAHPTVGARFGLAYEWSPGSRDGLGILFDWYGEKADGLVMGSPTTRQYATNLLAAGASYHLRPNLLGAVEFHHASCKDGASELTQNGWHMGLEFCPSSCLAIRAGLNDDHAAFGLGYTDARWRIGYSYADRVNDDVVGALLGGSATHKIEAAVWW